MPAARIAQAHRADPVLPAIATPAIPSCAADHKPPETLTPAAGCRSAFGARAPSFRAVDDEKPPGSRADAID